MIIKVTPLGIYNFLFKDLSVDSGVILGYSSLLVSIGVLINLINFLDSTPFLTVLISCEFSSIVSFGFLES